MINCAGVHADIVVIHCPYVGVLCFGFHIYKFSSQPGIGLPHEIAHGSLRFSLSEENTMEEADKAVDILKEIVEKLRMMSPLYDEFLAANKAN